MSPLARLRDFFSQCSDLKPMSTQAGLARLLGNSETLIRSIERGRARVTRKLAGRLGAVTGCDPAWLQLLQVEKDCPIPGIHGETVAFESVMRQMAAKIGADLNVAVHDALPTALPELQRKAIHCVLGMIETEIVGYWQGDRGLTDPMPELLEWLRKRAEARTAIPPTTPAASTKPR